MDDADNEPGEVSGDFFASNNGLGEISEAFFTFDNGSGEISEAFVDPGKSSGETVGEALAATEVLANRVQTRTHENQLSVDSMILVRFQACSGRPEVPANHVQIPKPVRRSLHFFSSWQWSRAQDRNRERSKNMQRKALKQLEKTEFLVASGKTQKSTVNDRLAVAVPEIFGEEEAPLAPDWNQLQEWGIAALETSLEEVRATDREHRGKVARLGKARKDRDAQFERLSAGHRALRKSFSGTYGVNALPLISLEAEPARALKAAREQMCEVVERMRDPQVAAELPVPLAGQRPIELEVVAEDRHTEVDELEAKMAEIDELRNIGFVDRLVLRVGGS